MTTRQFSYVPPKQLHDKRIWSLVVTGTREEKVSEYNLSRKNPLALNTWDKAMARLNKSKNGHYAKVVGIVSEELLVIDIDNHTTLPENCQQLINKYPTHHHKSKSGKGWKIYYFTDTPLPKKWIKHKSGELFSNMFVTTTDPELSDYTEEHIATLTREQIAEFIPEANKQLKPLTIPSGQTQAQRIHLDLDKVIAEVQRILDILPVDLDPILEVAYETKLQDTEVNGYAHWLLVSHALADLALLLASEYPNATIRIQGLFHNWSSNGKSYKDEEDCNERFNRSLKETQASTDPIISFNTLRKLFWAYRIPTSDFPVVLINSSGQKKVDASDPENFEFLTRALNIKLCQDVSRGNLYITGPKAIIKNYFSDNQFYFLTQDSEHLSVPFSAKQKSDDNLIFRLVKLFRHFGIRGTLRSHPIYAGLNNLGIQPLDTLFEWMDSKPWDKVPRIFDIIKQSIELDESMIPSGVTEDFFYSLIFKHLTHMAGLRAKAYRTIANKQLPTDRYKKAQGMLILAGYQNTHKSTWIECLLPSQASFVSNVTPSSVKDTLEIQRALSGTFVLNIDEVDAVLSTVNLSDFKNVITQDRDSFRTMYSQVFEDHPRAAGLFGTTNKQHLRLDRTGNRRFWIIPIKQCDAEPFNRCDYQQVWAELLYNAENLNADEWNITGQERSRIDLIARQYTSQTIGGKSLDMAFTDENGESLLFDHTEFDFDLLFKDFPQKLQRLFVSKKLFFPVTGNKCFIHLQNKFLMDDNIEFKLSSFNHEINGFLDNLMGFHNVTKAYDKLYYKEGVVNYRTGKLEPTKYHFIPYREPLINLIETGFIPLEVLLASDENN